MSLDCSPCANDFRLVLLHADDSNRVRLASMARVIDDGQPVAEWALPARYWVAGYAPGIILLTWFRDDAAAGAISLKLDGRDRLNLGLLPRHVSLHQEWLLGLAELAAGQMILVDAARTASALWAMCAFMVSDLQVAPMLPLIGVKPVKVERRQARLVPAALWSSS